MNSEGGESKNVQNNSEKTDMQNEAKESDHVQDKGGETEMRGKNYEKQDEKGEEAENVNADTEDGNGDVGQTEFASPAALPQTELDEDPRLPGLSPEHQVLAVHFARMIRDR